MRVYQVEYMSRPDEREHIRSFGTDFIEAHRFALKISDKHDTSAMVIALERHKDGYAATGYMEYVFGERSVCFGTLEKVSWPI